MVKHMLAGGSSIYDAINQLVQDLNKWSYYNLFSLCKGGAKNIREGIKTSIVILP